MYLYLVEGWYIKLKDQTCGNSKDCTSNIDLGHVKATRSDVSVCEEACDGEYECDGFIATIHGCYLLADTNCGIEKNVDHDCHQKKTCNQKSSRPEDKIKVCICHKFTDLKHFWLL